MEAIAAGDEIDDRRPIPNLIFFQGDLFAFLMFSLNKKMAIYKQVINNLIFFI